MSTECCAQPYKVLAPIDRILPEGIRFRQIPADVCLNCQSIDTHGVVSSAAFQNSLSNFLQNAGGDFQIVKAVTDRDSTVGGKCSGCEQNMETADLDVSIGKNAELVFEKIKGYWCWKCRKGFLSDEGKKLKDLLRGFSLTRQGIESVSLIYETPSHPRSVQFEVSTRCNLKCSYCTHRLLTDKNDVSIADFERMLSAIDLDCIDNVDFTGLGEPVLNPELPAMIRAVRKLSTPTHIRVVTNGTILTPERVEALCDAGITSIAVSIDSLDAGIFARNRGGASLPIVLRNLENLVDYREKKGLKSMAVKIKAVLTDDHYSEAERFLIYSAKLGLEMPHFSCLDTRREAQKNYSQDWLQNNWGTNGSAVFSVWAQTRWDQLSHSGGDLPNPYPAPSDRIAGYISPSLLPNQDLCRWIIDAAFISIDGSSLACCEQMIDVPRRLWGKVQASSLRELWNGELLWGYRLPLSLGYVPTGCIGCPWAPSEGKPIDRREVQQIGRTSRSRSAMPKVERPRG